MVEWNEVEVDCGRTPNRGNYVSLSYNDFEVCLFDNRGVKKSISQSGLKEICKQQLEIIFNKDS